MAVSRVFIAGVTPKGVARRAARKAHNPNYREGKLDGWQMNAVQRRNELARLVKCRRRAGASLGPESGWIEVIANYVRVRHGQVSSHDVYREAGWLGLPRLDPQLVDDAVGHIARAAWGRYQLFTPKLAGDKLRLTMAERQQAEIQKLEAIDEPRAERKRRLDRERKAATRAAGAAPRSPTKSEIAKGLGISRAELYRRIKSGEIDETLLVRQSSP